MLVQQADVLISHLLTEHLADTVAQQSAVKTDKALFRQLTYQSCDVLVFNISIGIKLTALGSVRSLTIAHKELEF